MANIDLLINASKNDCLLLFELKYNNVIIGVRFVLKFKNDLYGWYAGSLSKYYSYFPNDLLIWETIKWGAENGYKLFDYGGAGNPNVDYGVRKFKLQSGGEIVNYGRYELVHKPFAYFIARTGFEFWRLFNRNR
ncbi:MAG: GNAT family N-acetyltransferase [Ferruginibacter sp.]